MCILIANGPTPIHVVQGFREIASQTCFGVLVHKDSFGNLEALFRTSLFEDSSDGGVELSLNRNKAVRHTNFKFAVPRQYPPDCDPLSESLRWLETGHERHGNSVPNDWS